MTSLLLMTSLLGSLLGFYICFEMTVKFHLLHNPMRVCMLNSMSLAFIFAMFVELTTASKMMSVLAPILLVCVPILFMMKPLSLLDFIESLIANLMSVSMSVMLVGMVASHVVWLIQCVLVFVEVMLFVSVRREVRPHSM